MAAMIVLARPCAFVGVLLSLAARNASGAEPSGDTNAVWLAEHYTKYEHRIPMRDGVRLFTRVYVPKDDSQKWPIILTRTPYALKPYGADNYTDPSGSFRTLAKDKFILVTQDVRGRYGSEGVYVHVRPFNPNKGPTECSEFRIPASTPPWG
jgi:predicted acyl esterase